MCVDTGGRSLRLFDFTRSNGEFRYNADFGVMELSLFAGGYTWEFISSDGTVRDSGSESCHE